MQNLHPKLVLFNNKDHTPSLDNPWTVGTGHPFIHYQLPSNSKDHWAKLTQEYRVKYSLLLYSTWKALQPRQDTGAETYLVHTPPHELHTAFEVQELDWLKGRKKTIKVGVRETGWRSTRKYKPRRDIVFGSNSHSNKAAGPRELKPEILGLIPGNWWLFTSSQTCVPRSSEQKQLLCLSVCNELFTSVLYQQLAGLLCENQMSHPGSLEALANSSELQTLCSLRAIPSARHLPVDMTDVIALMLHTYLLPTVYKLLKRFINTWLPPCNHPALMLRHCQCKVHKSYSYVRLGISQFGDAANFQHGQHPFHQFLKNKKMVKRGGGSKGNVYTFCGFANATHFWGGRRKGRVFSMTSILWLQNGWSFLALDGLQVCERCKHIVHSSP